MKSTSPAYLFHFALLLASCYKSNSSFYFELPSRASIRLYPWNDGEAWHFFSIVVEEEGNVSIYTMISDEIPKEGWGFVNPGNAYIGENRFNLEAGFVYFHNEAEAKLTNIGQLADEKFRYLSADLTELSSR